MAEEDEGTAQVTGGQGGRRGEATTNRKNLRQRLHPQSLLEVVLFSAAL